MLLGLKLAFNFADVNVSHSRSLASPVQRITDSYSLGGHHRSRRSCPPRAGNTRGAFDIPGPVIDHVPTQRSIATIPNGALTTGSRELEVDMYGWKLGPWVEVPFTTRLSFSAGAGLAWAVVDSEFRFHETTSVAGVGAFMQAASDTNLDAVVGAYAEAGLSFSLTDAIGIFVSGEFQHLNSVRHTVSGRQATLDLGEVWALTTGFRFSF